MSLKQRWKEKWGIETESQFWRIMVVFSLAGYSCLYVRRPIFAALEITAETPGYVWWLAWFSVIFPSYCMLLMFWGKILGVFPFSKWFVQKMLRRFKLYNKPDQGPPKLS